MSDFLLCVGGVADGRWVSVDERQREFITMKYTPIKIKWGESIPNDLSPVERVVYVRERIRAPAEYDINAFFDVLRWSELSPLEMFQKLLRGYATQHEREKVKT